ncbi:MAG: manganese transporter ATP-binding protein [Chloroflexi bacterium]|nr:manganese transporter ATP-binding protein [Chloroflexota bacterium]
MSRDGTWGLRVDALTVAYGANVALEAVSVVCEPGEIVGLLGPNGSGKSTLLKAVLGLLPKVSGSITLNGAIVDRGCRARMAYAPQRGEVDWTFPITVEEVVLLGRQGRHGLFGRPGRADRQIAHESLERLRMRDFRGHQIGALSAGQQQRVFLARAVAQQGEVLLLDEPLTGVDAQTQVEVLDLVDDLRSQGLAIVMTTHDLAQAAQVCNRICLLNRHIVADGAPSEVLTPRALMETYGGRDAIRFAGAAQQEPTTKVGRARARAVSATQRTGDQ